MTVLTVKMLYFLVFSCFLFTLLPAVLSQTEGDQVYYYDEYGESSVSGVEPNFDVPIINVTVVEGQSAVLPCSVDGMTNQKIVWLAPNKAPITMENKRIYDDTRFNIITNNNNHKEWNLHIADIKYEDRGIFKCTINTTPVKYKDVILHVQVPPKVLEESTSRDLVVREEQSAEIVCNITGVPKPSITWFVKYIFTNDQRKIELDAVGTSIRINNTTRLSDAEYECVGENGIPPPISKKIILNIEFKPKVRIINPRLGQMQGRETMLDCIVEANPQATITWYKEGNKVVSSARNKLDAYEELAYKMILSLRISGIKHSDYGDYECEARNPLGSSKGIMELYEYIPIVKTPAPRTTTTFIHQTSPRKYKSTSRKNKANIVNKKQNRHETKYHNNTHHSNNHPGNSFHVNKHPGNDFHGNYQYEVNGNKDASNQLPHQQSRNHLASDYVDDYKDEGILYRIVNYYGSNSRDTMTRYNKIFVKLTALCFTSLLIRYSVLL